MIKCIASDMDGTLLGEQHMISEETVQLIKEAQKKGIEFLVATGRAYNEARYILNQADIHCPAICVNGGEIRDKDGNIEFAIGLDGKVSKEIEKVFNEFGVYFEVYTPSGTYTTDRNVAINLVAEIYHSITPEHEIEVIRGVAEERFLEGLIDTIESYNHVFDQADSKVYKFLAFDLDEEKLEQTSAKLNEIEGIDVTSSGRHNIEVMHTDARKGVALKRFVEERGITLDETMALGDNYNDLSMLSIVGHSVAMGNAEQPVKDIAKEVTDTNVNDGVAKMIKKAIAQLEIAK